MLLCASTQLAANQSSLASVEDLRLLDQRVARVGHRLATGAAALCPDQQWLAGFLIHDLSQYSRAGRQQAIQLFGLDHGPAVLALAERGPADQAGLRVDDVVLTADGVRLPRSPDGAHGTFAPTEQIMDALDSAFADGRAELTIRRAGETRTMQIRGVSGCASRFQVVPSDQFRARADGRYVQLTSAMVEYARGDDELAALLAHELAHNVLRHRARLRQAGVERGEGADRGRSARLIRRTELEADRWAVYLMDRAGFDPAAAVRLWTRQSREDFISDGDHPSWSSRIAAMEAELSSIARARARGKEPRPPPSDARLGNASPVG